MDIPDVLAMLDEHIRYLERYSYHETDRMHIAIDQFKFFKRKLSDAFEEELEQYHKDYLASQKTITLEDAADIVYAGLPRTGSKNQ